ncbi:tRNA adenosine(34) deaminase TadA [Christensenellaceae bacterium OttesenSCG-928-M15]|nr:tRNA adenosine(34) deaminase TadA [Christensenellaceae bacterium OttesenSCG-928-M15]
MDERFMRMAIEEAQRAFDLEEVPVGAVVVKQGKVIARAHNLCEAANDPMAHAELLALREAARQENGRLEGCTLYVTLEPCAMCAGAAILARVSRIVFGAFDEQAGCCGSVADITDHWFSHSIQVYGGLFEEECAVLLHTFFERKRRL